MKIKDIATLVTTSVDPRNHPNIYWNLYSLPSFDDNRTCEVVLGREIQSNKFVVPSKCILFNKLNVRFKRIWCVNNQEINNICSTEFLPLVIDETKADYDYMYYLLRSDFITTYLTGQHNNTSNSHNRIDIDDFMNIEISLPSISEQKRLAKVVLDIDNQIDNLTAINRNLEQVAHQLYDYWFIQFDFPNHEGKPYKSSGGEMVWNEALKRCIPIGWKDCFISDVEADIVTGKTPSTSDETNFGEDIPFVTIDDIRGHYFVFETSRNLSLKGADAQSSKYLPKGSLFCSCIGTPGVIGFAGTKVQTNQQINSIRFKHKSNAVFLYYGIKLYFSYANAKIGNILPNMSKGEFEKILIVYPGETIIRKFDDLISPVFNEIEINSQSIISLLKMRDELLPMLLNGQVNCDLSYYHIFFQFLFPADVLQYTRKSCIFALSDNQTKR